MKELADREEFARAFELFRKAKSPKKIFQVCLRSAFLLLCLLSAFYASASSPQSLLQLWSPLSGRKNSPESIYEGLAIYICIINTRGTPP